MRIFSTIILTLVTFTTFSQTKMKEVNELINEKDSGWPFVKEWIASAKNKVEILSVNKQTAKETLYKTQVTTRSPMGSIIYETGGLLIDNGWIRILGSGNEKLKRTLPDWNLGKSFKNFGEQAPFLLIADDAIGGFFLLNGGGLGNDLGKIYYFAPDSLAFEPINLTYTEFLDFCFNNNLQEFYKDYRWKSWKEDVSKLNGDSVFNFFPYLWSKEGKNIEKTSRKEIPIEEQYGLNLDFRKQMGIDK
ncbi:MAG: DUF2625 domain-containing protein [Flavobacterium sp.]